MTDTYRYKDDDLVAVVWPRQSAQLVHASGMTWQQAVSGPFAGWAMAAEKASRVRVLLAVHDDVVQGAWRVLDADVQSEIPEGKSRVVGRAYFKTADDPRLDFLLAAPSPIDRRRNPQGVLELRDLPGAGVLLATTEPPRRGVVQLGGYTLLVDEDGRAELRIPTDGVASVRLAPAGTAVTDAH